MRRVDVCRKEREIARRLIEEHGQTFAAQAGITLKDEPGPLWQLLVLALLSSAPIASDVAAATAEELWKAGWRTSAKLRDSTWQQRVDALGRGGYRRYDESTATRLDDDAKLLQDRWGGDLRRLRDEAEGGTKRMAKALQEFEGIGPVGADIFLREAQAVWPVVRPYTDKLVAKGAKAVGLPTDARDLAELLGDDDLSSLSAALVRVAHEPGLLKED